MKGNKKQEPKGTATKLITSFILLRIIIFIWVGNQEEGQVKTVYGSIWIKKSFCSRKNNEHLGYGDPLIGFCPYFLQDQKSEGSPSFLSLPTFSPILTATTVFSTIFLSHAGLKHKTSKQHFTKTRKEKSLICFYFLKQAFHLPFL